MCRCSPGMSSTMFLSSMLPRMPAVQHNKDAGQTCHVMPARLDRQAQLISPTTTTTQDKHQHLSAAPSQAHQPIASCSACEPGPHGSPSTQVLGPLMAGSHVPTGAQWHMRLGRAGSFLWRYSTHPRRRRAMWMLPWLPCCRPVAAHPARLLPSTVWSVLSLHPLLLGCAGCRAPPGLSPQAASSRLLAS